MQGNAFLGAFFAVSPFLQEFDIPEERFKEVVHAQYVKKFDGGRGVRCSERLRRASQGMPNISRRAFACREMLAD
ncbi:MAG: hypothetical protein ACI9HE_003517 [Planctomycetota bacterium]|jgi:hypothetical protein